MKLMNNKYIDMHTHSIYSDGELEVEELIRRAIDNNVGILSLVKYSLFDFSFKESTRRIIEKFGKETTLSSGIQEIENYNKNRKDWNNQLSSELCLQIGIRLMEEEAYEESRKWFLRTIHKTVSMLDIDSSQVIPNRYLEILDSKKKVHI